MPERTFRSADQVGNRVQLGAERRMANAPRASIHTETNRGSSPHYQEQIIACDEEIGKRIVAFAARVDTALRPLPPDRKLVLVVVFIAPRRLVQQRMIFRRGALR